MQMNKGEVSSICTFYIPRKQRFCRLRTFRGYKFCAEHIASECEGILDVASNEKVEARIPCPLDSSHTCFINRLEIHMKKCNARDKDQPVYYQKHINSGPEDDFTYQKVSLSDISDEELLGFITKILKVYQDHVPTLMKNCNAYKLLQEELQNKNYGTSALKHLQQQASLISLMEENNLLRDDVCYVEFGAGRGQLTYWIIQAVPHCDTCNFILVDKASQKHKYDNKFKEEESLRIERIRIDIEHLCLRKVPGVAPFKSKLIGVSKHLCGSATDLALKCMMDTEENGSSLNSDQFLGILIALCCHHSCNWKNYVGKQFLQNVGFSAQDFHILCALTSWATCGSRAKEDNMNSEDDSSMTGKKVNRYQRLGLSPKYREEIGRKTKILLDMGRADYLKQKNYNVELIIYVESSVSLENIALLAMPMLPSK